MSLARVGGDAGSAGQTMRSNVSSGAHTAAGVTFARQNVGKGE